MNDLIYKIRMATIFNFKAKSSVAIKVHRVKPVTIGQSIRTANVIAWLTADVVIRFMTVYRIDFPDITRVLMAIVSKTTRFII